MKQTTFFELPLQVFLSIRPDFSKFFPASSFSPDEPYLLLDLMGACSLKWVIWVINGAWVL